MLESSHGKQHGRAFTLLELILVIALVGLLLSLLSPALFSARQFARTGISLSNLRLHAAAFEMYGTDAKGQAPYLVAPTPALHVIRNQTHDVAVAVPYFESNVYWNIGLADTYYAGDPWSRSFRSPFRTTPISRDFPMATTYSKTCALLASPEYFIMESRTYPPIGLRGVRLDEVVFPSKKSVLGDYATVKFGGQSPTISLIGFFDGHAARVAQVHIDDPGDGLAAFEHYGGHLLGRFQFPFLHTFAGVRARDLE